MHLHAIYTCPAGRELTARVPSPLCIGRNLVKLRSLSSRNVWGSIRGCCCFTGRDRMLGLESLEVCMAWSSQFYGDMPVRRDARERKLHVHARACSLVD